MTIKFRHGTELLRPIPVASGTVISVGDQVHRVSGKLQRMSAASDNLTFMGVAREGHASTDKSGELLVSLPVPGAVYEITLNSATAITFGDELQWNAHQKAKKSTTDAIWTAMESKLAATTIHATFQLANSSNLQLVADNS